MTQHYHVYFNKGNYMNWLDFSTNSFSTKKNNIEKLVDLDIYVFKNTLKKA